MIEDTDHCPGRRVAVFVKLLPNRQFDLWRCSCGTSPLFSCRFLADNICNQHCLPISPPAETLTIKYGCDFCSHEQHSTADRDGDSKIMAWMPEAGKIRSKQSCLWMSSLFPIIRRLHVPPATPTGAAAECWTAGQRSYFKIYIMPYIALKF